MRKTIFIILLIALLFLMGIIWFGSKVSLPVPPEKTPPEEKQVTLSLLSEKKEFNLGEEAREQVVLDSLEYEADGVDIVLNYEPQYLEFKEIDYSDSVFKTFPPYSVEQEKGKISFSALSSPGETFQGKGKVATISFQALKQGESEIYFEFQLGTTNDSNVASQGKDILERVDNLKILVK